jgi:hypothetical protein
MSVAIVENTNTPRREWWGYSKEHGWVMLDREIPCNTPGIRADLMFYRCRDGKIFFLKWELWKLPAYQFAPNYVNGLTGAAAEEARSEYEALLSNADEHRLELKRQYQAILDEEGAARQAEALQLKEAASKARKLRTAAARAQTAAVDADEEQGSENP